MPNLDSGKLTTAELEILRTEDSFKMLQRIFSRVLTIEGQEGEFELKKLEAFSNLDGQGERHKKGFDERERIPGEVFVAWMMGSPILTIVVDPEKRSLVRINEVEQEGRKLSIKALLEGAGYKRNDYPDAASYKAAVTDFIDGQQTMSTTYESSINLVEPKETELDPVFSIRKDTKAKIANNSFGTFLRV